MFYSGKCPHCEKTVASANVETIQINAGTQASYKGVTYLCPHCRRVLTVSMDQISLNEDLVARLLKALGRG
jgi:phage terminase large subunit GpA-like protein